MAYFIEKRLGRSGITYRTQMMFKNEARIEYREQTALYPAIEANLTPPLGQRSDVRIRESGTRWSDSATRSPVYQGD
jgi:hypothetical protein